MSKIKIYLSKSKAGSFDNIVQAKSLLKEFNNVEVLEFVGGKYTLEKLNKSNILVVLSPKLPKVLNYKFTVGKGQYTEIHHASYKLRIPVFCILTMGEEIYGAEGGTWNLIEEDWQTQWAEIFPKERLKSFKEILAEYEESLEHVELPF